MISCASGAYRYFRYSVAISRVPLRRIEVIRNGEVIASTDAAARERSLRIEEHAVVDRHRQTGLHARDVAHQAREDVALRVPGAPGLGYPLEAHEQAASQVAHDRAGDPRALVLLSETGGNRCLPERLLI